MARLQCACSLNEGQLQHNASSVWSKLSGGFVVAGSAVCVCVCVSEFNGVVCPLKTQVIYNIRSLTLDQCLNTVDACFLKLDLS